MPCGDNVCIGVGDSLNSKVALCGKQLLVVCLQGAWDEVPGASLVLRGPHAQRIVGPPRVALNCNFI